MTGQTTITNEGSNLELSACADHAVKWWTLEGMAQIALAKYLHVPDVPCTTCGEPAEPHQLVMVETFANRWWHLQLTGSCRTRWLHSRR